MDESKPSFPSDELSLRPASDWKSAAVDAAPADLAKSDKFVAPGRQRHSDQSELCRNDLADGSSVVVYCRNEEVSQGYLIALRAMGVAVVERLPETAKPPVTRAKP